jgi:hypothetical protein
MALLVWALASTAGCDVRSNHDGFSTVRIGYQKAGILNLLRLRGGLESVLEKLGVEVR